MILIIEMASEFPPLFNVFKRSESFSRKFDKNYFFNFDSMVDFNKILSQMKKEPIELLQFRIFRKP